MPRNLPGRALPLLMLGLAWLSLGCGPGPRGEALGGDRASGMPGAETLWRRDTGRGIETPPSLAGRDSVFVATTDRRLQLIDAVTGRMLWRKRLGGALTGPPEVALGNLVATTLLPDGAAYRLDLQRRKFVWRKPVGEAVGRPRLFEGTLLVPTRDGRVHGLSPADGRTIWVTNLGTTVTGDPALAPERALLLVPGRDGQLYGVDARSGEKRWVTDLKEPLLGVAADSGTVAVTGLRGGLFVLDALNGRGIWSVATRAPLAGAPVITGHTVLLATLDGQVLAWNREDGVARWRRSLGGPFRTPPVIDGPRALVVGVSGLCWLLALADGEPLAAWRHPESVLTAPLALGEGRWLVPGERGMLELSADRVVGAP